MIFDSISMIGFSQALAYYPSLQFLTEHLIPSSFRRKFADHSRMTREKTLRRKESKVDKNDLISNLLKEENGITNDELFGNSMTLIVAGSETTATVLAGVTWYLLKNERCLEILNEEVWGRCKSEEEIDFVGVGQLKYMFACLNEAMRIFPPAPVGHPRIFPGVGEEVDGKFVPGGAQVSIFRYAANLSPRNFSRPNEYHPERWLGDPEFEHDDLAVMQPFSYGPRNCIGKK
jgi:cytochrome P450